MQYPYCGMSTSQLAHPPKGSNNQVAPSSVASSNSLLEFSLKRIERERNQSSLLDQSLLEPLPLQEEIELCHPDPLSSWLDEIDIDSPDFVRKGVPSDLEEPSAKRHKPSASSVELEQNQSHLESQWLERYEELLAFKKKCGHCRVPHTFADNPSLARWVKRQRYQYKLRQEGRKSNMTDERIRDLEKVGFVWDSHSASWINRLNELHEYRCLHGHTNVPGSYIANPQLATWVKCQRRQFKLYSEGRPSSLSPSRIQDLEKLGFEWTSRTVTN